MGGEGGVWLGGGGRGRAKLTICIAASPIIDIYQCYDICFSALHLLLCLLSMIVYTCFTATPPGSGIVQNVLTFKTVFKLSCLHLKVKNGIKVDNEKLT